ncbi:MAG: DUF2460 domain-containing protein [Burkholderiales bacterium]|nr:DUF2460 domain-containing protein [Burkholderiales bacterium]
MDFIETPRFPESISAGAHFGPAYSTSIARNQGGGEVRNQNWTYPLCEGDVSYGVRTQAQLDDLLAFFHGVAGMHKAFRFKNFSDYTAVGAQGALTEIVADTTWQMHKIYTFGALMTPKKISKPVEVGLVVGGTGVYTVDTTTGIVTRTSGANPTGWTGTFDIPCRFNIDRMLPQWVAYKLYEWSAIPIVEIRL